jgi:hypothetical protein
MEQGLVDAGFVRNLLHPGTIHPFADKYLLRRLNNLLFGTV